MVDTDFYPAPDVARITPGLFVRDAFLGWHEDYPILPTQVREYVEVADRLPPTLELSGLSKFERISNYYPDIDFEFCPSDVMIGAAEYIQELRTREEFKDSYVLYREDITRIAQIIFNFQKRNSDRILRMVMDELLTKLDAKNDVS